MVTKGYYFLVKKFNSTFARRGKADVKLLETITKELIQNSYLSHQHQIIDI